MRRLLLGLAGSFVFTASGCSLPFLSGSTPANSDLPGAQTALKADQVEKSPSETAKLCFATAKQLEDTGNNEEAIARYEKARASDARYTDAATRRLAILYDKQGNLDRARAEHEKILSKYPKDADTLNNLGYGYMLREHWDLAEQNLRKAIAASPEHKAAWVNLGMTLAHKQQYDDSLKAFVKAVPPAHAQCNLAFVLTTQGKREEAKQAYREALRADPGLQFARQALAKLENPGPSPSPNSSTTRKEDTRPPSRTPPSPTLPHSPGGHVIDTEAPFIVDTADAVPAPSRK